MPVLDEIEKMALELNEYERGRLVANLLESLPPVRAESDADIAEALRRNAELDADPSRELGLEELQSRLSARFPR